MAESSLTGGCHCGAIRYTVGAPATDTHHCHCGICRKVQGALFVTLSTFPRDKFLFEKGANNLSTYDSSEKVHRNFCKSCGCHVTIDVDEAPDIVLITTGTLDGGKDPGHPRETLRHAYVDSKVPWYVIGDDLPQE